MLVQADAQLLDAALLLEPGLRVLQGREQEDSNSRVMQEGWAHMGAGGRQAGK